MNPFDGVVAGIGFAMSLLLLAPFLLLGLAFPYLVIRLRETKDPQAGFKVGLQFFFSVAVLLILTGLTIIVVDWAMKEALFGAPRGGQRAEQFPNAAQRNGFAFIASGLVFAAIHFLLLLIMTRDVFSSPIRRTFLGWRFAIHGLIVMVGVTWLLVDLFQETRRLGDAEIRRFLIGLLIVWAPSWLIHLVLLRLAAGRPAADSPALEDDDRDVPRHPQEPDDDD